MKRIAIVGGGAAGLMCGVAVLEGLSMKGDAEVCLFERGDKLGVKVALSGGGRCNLTTGIVGEDELLGKYPRGAEFLRSIFAQFGPAEIARWFETHDLPLVTEDNFRMFPTSGQGRDVVRVFERIFAQNSKMEVKYNTVVKDIAQNKRGKFVMKFAQNGGDLEEKLFDIVVLATGGNAYVQTGSRGDGYEFARKLGHSVTPLAPSLSSLLVADKWARELSGLSLVDARLTVDKDNNSKCLSELVSESQTKKECLANAGILKQVQDDRGEIQDGKNIEVDGGFMFAHFGVTGPVVFALSAVIAFVQFDEANPLEVRLVIDKNKTVKDWDKILQTEFAQNGKLKLWQVLARLIPKKLAPVVCELLGVNPKVAEIGKNKRWQIAQILGDGLSLSVIGRRPGDEFVTAGGVDTKDINSKTCESKLVSNLYFVGELLNIDGFTGGFNLTACWATGYLAGKSILRKNWNR